MQHTQTMDSRTITRIVDILEIELDFFVPVKKLWLQLREEGLAQDVEIEDFHRILTEDERFEFAPDVDYRENVENDPEYAQQMEQEMEALGFYGGPRVKLASREMTAEDVFAAMARSLARMNAALQGAWDTRPQGDRAVEDQLLDILAAGQKLEREIDGLIEGHRESPDQEPGD